VRERGKAGLGWLRLDRLDWAPGTAQVGCCLFSSSFFVLFSFSFVFSFSDLGFELANLV
jgi:hypothetical protein